jgi:alpha-mannosidase
VTENGPLRASVEFETRISPGSYLKQTVSLTCVSPRLDFDTWVDWHEKQVFLKVEFPIQVRAELATYEIQFGHVQRPTHYNTSYDLARFEVCAHRWADFSEHGYGVALLNDCKYGYSAYQNVMRLSLLRGSFSQPDPTSDQGQHRFRYALLPHSGSLQEAGVIAEGYRFNVPLLLARSTRAQAGPFFEVDQPAVVIDTVKKAEDSRELILRLYESFGGRWPVRLKSSLPVISAVRCNLLEEEVSERLEWPEDGLEMDLQPFELLTIKLRLAEPHED